MTGILRAGLTLLLLTTLVACGAGSDGSRPIPKLA